MKVAHVINSLGKGGAEKLLSDLLPLLNKQVEITLIVLTTQDNVYGLELKKNNIEVVFLSDEKNVKKLSVFRLLKNYFKYHKFDIIHVHLFPSQYFVPFATKNKLVFTEHSTTSKRRKSLFIPLERFIYRKYIKYIFVSKQSKKSFEDFLKINNGNKNLVICNGIDTNLEEVVITNDIHKELDIDSKQKIITMISSFKPEKDHETLIRSMNQLSDVHLLLLGEGVLKESMYNLVNDLNLKNRVHFLGFRKNVKEYIVQSDLIVQSSFKEGFGLSVLEAMSLAKSVLVSDIDGLKEVVDNEKYRFTVGNVYSLVSKANELLYDNNEIKLASEYSLRTSRKFDINNTAQKYLDLYEELK